MGYCHGSRKHCVPDMEVLVKANSVEDFFKPKINREGESKNCRNQVEKFWAIFQNFLYTWNTLKGDFEILENKITWRKMEISRYYGIDEILCMY